MGRNATPRLESAFKIVGRGNIVRERCALRCADINQRRYEN